MQEDTAKVNTLNAIASVTYITDPDEAISYGTEARSLAEQINYPAGEALAYKNIGLAYYFQGEFAEAARNWEPSLQIYEELGDAPMIANLLSNLGAIYHSIGKNMEAIEYYHRALKFVEEGTDSTRLATLVINIGVLYSELPETYDLARDYYSRAIEMGESLGDIEIMGLGNMNLGQLYMEKEEYDSALFYFEKSLTILTNPVYISSALNFIASIYAERGDYQAALTYSQDALELARQENAQREIVGILLGLASIYEDLKNHSKAIEYFKQAESLAVETGLNEELSSTFEGLATNYAHLQDYHNAYKYLYKQNTIDETQYRIASEDQSKDLIYKYEMEKKQSEIALLEHQSEMIQMFLKRRRTIIGAIFFGIVLLVFTGLILHRFRYIRKVNVKINDQKDEIEAQRDEIEAQRDEVEAQRDQLKVQNDVLVVQKGEIIDSISYAHRIQSALIPPEQNFHELLNEVFILFKPRDIVSGDFYWIKQVNQFIVLVAADCTGHGVPGALMSMLGISYLNEIVNRREVTQANQILNELRNQIKQSLRQYGQPDESKDGMDMALCVIDKKKRVLQYSGANNPLYIIRNNNGSPELQEFKADKMPVGYYQGKFKTFTNNDIQLEYGDVFYMFSDGFVDQKGGKNNKKYLTKNFKNLLLRIHEEPMQEQKRILDQTIADWMGDNSQIDDMLVLGVRV